MKFLRHDKIGEQGDVGSGNAGFDERRHGRMDLVTTQLNRSRRHGAPPGIGREHVCPGTPREIALGIGLEGIAERRPVRALRGAFEGRNLNGL